MKKVSIVLILTMLILTGCFEKKTRVDDGSNSDYLEIIDFTAVDNPSGSGNGNSTDSGSTSGSPIIIESSTLVPVDKIVTISFTESINAQTVDATSVYIYDQNQQPIAAELTVVDNQINIIPSEFFSPYERYTIVITTAVKDIRGRSLEGVFYYRFSTVPLSTSFPTLLSLSPANGTQAPNSTFVEMRFSESIAGNGVIIVKESNTNAVVNGSTSIVGSTLRFIPQNRLVNGANYTATLQGTVEDLEGNAYTGISTWSFTVEPSPDTTPPSLVSVIPADGAINVDIGTDINVAFDEAIADNGVILEVRDSLNVLVAGTNTFDADTLNFAPTSDLSYGESYTVTLFGTVEDLSGNTYTGTSSWSFTVASLLPLPDITPPNLVSVIPADGAINVDIDTDINVTFDENITSGDSILLLTDNTLGMSVVGISGGTANTLSFIPNSVLIEGHHYTIDIHGPIRDLAGNVYTGETSWSFTVVPLVDNVPPNLTSLTPQENATHVDKTTNIVMTFDENIADNGVTLEVRDSSTSTLVGGTTIINGNTLTFNPTSDLTEGESYTITLIGNVEDLSTNVYTGISTWSFTVAPLVDSIPPTLVSLTPQENATHVDQTTNIVMTFDENIADNGVTLEVRDSNTSTLVGGTTIVSGNSITFNPTNDLTEGERYTVTLQGNIEDLSGNIYTGISIWNFSVISFPPSTLTVVRIKYNNNKITIKFYEKLDTSTVSANDFLINGGTIGFSEFKVKNGENEVEFTSDTPLNGDEVITVSGTIKDIYGNFHNDGTSADYNVSGVLSVRKVKRSGDKITIEFWEISSKLDASTVSENDFLINGGAIGFSGFKMKNDFDVEFSADTPLSGDELITISGDIQDMDGNFHNNGVAVIHSLR